MTRTSRDPLDGIDRLLIDGNNLLHALHRPSRSSERPPAPLPATGLIGRLRAAIPATVRVEIVFDGPPAPGSGGRIAAGVKVLYSGARPADDVLIELVEQDGPPPPGYEPTILVCTGDAELRHSLLTRGAATVRPDWLIRRLERTTLSAPSVGARRSPPGPVTADDTDADRGTWQPGRGATAKKGNARRAPKHGRPPARTGPRRRKGPPC